MHRQAEVSRGELLSWINGLFHTDYKSIESASNGAVACQILDYIYPHSVPMKLVDFSAETPYACQKNYKIFQSAVNKLNLPIAVDISTLSKQGARESYSFMALMKRFFDNHFNQSDLAQENHNKSRSLDGLRSDYPLSPLSTKQSGKGSCVPFTDASMSPTTPSMEETLPSLYQRLMTVEKEKQQLKNDLTNLNTLMQRQESMRVVRENMLIKERVFFFNKLRAIELLLQEMSDVRELTAVEKEILDIMYSTEGLESSDEAGERIEEGSTRGESTKVDVQA